MTWALGKTVLFRTAIFVGMASVVTTIIYFSPVPGQEFVSCQRECHELEMPMICRVRLVLELVPATTASALGGCPRNSTGRGCSSDDGSSRWVVAANRQLPGPSIHVCQHDILVVDVENKMAGIETAVHWRGQRVRETPFMDGVAMVTQCPVNAGATFQYKLRAADAGTHLWHARAPPALGGDGAFGALVVRQSLSRRPHAALYDIDDEDHVAVIGVCPEGQALLVNGQRDPKGHTFELVAGQRHLLRLVNGFGLQQGGRCAVSVSLEGHEVLVVALDGHPIEPRRASSVHLAAGERADVVVSASNPSGGLFALRVDADVDDACAEVLPGVATLRYASTPTPTATSTPTPTPLDDASAPALSTRLDGDSCSGARACLTEVRAHHAMADALRTKETDVNLFLRFGVTDVAANASDALSWAYRHRVPSTDGITFVSPSSPLLTQPEEAVEARVCSRRRRAKHCADAIAPCECVHVKDIALGASVEMILADAGGSARQQVFHLHGQSFHVVGVGQASVSEREARRLDAEGTLLSRNLVDAVVKDTVAVPLGGLVALRFLADNPGYWLLENSHEPGMNVVLHVGLDGDTPATPAQFPRCRGFVGPDFFLI